MAIFSKWNLKYDKESNIEINFGKEWSSLDERNLNIFILDKIKLRLKPQELFVNAYSSGELQVFKTEQKAIGYVECARDDVLDYRYKAVVCTGDEFNEAPFPKAQSYNGRFYIHKDNQTPVYQGEYKNPISGSKTTNYILEVIEDNMGEGKCETGKYRAFKNGDEFEPFENKRILCRDARDNINRVLVTEYNNQEVKIQGNDISWKLLFKYYCFSDGTPCGVEMDKLENR
jgi:hypothetical protein